VNSMEIFVPITSKNYPSVHGAENVVALSLSVCVVYFYFLHHKYIFFVLIVSLKLLVLLF
jgi:hypothetical protein